MSQQIVDPPRRYAEFLTPEMQITAGHAFQGVQGGGRAADPSKLNEIIGRDDATALSALSAPQIL
jgi:hypothetical protein